MGIFRFTKGHTKEALFAHAEGERVSHARARHVAPLTGFWMSAETT